MKPQLLQGSRSRILAAVIIILSLVIVVRLFYLQIIQHGFYAQLAEGEQVLKDKLPAKRGEIYALNGDEPVKLAINSIIYTVFVDPSIIQNPDGIAETMRSVAGAEVVKDFDKLLALKDTQYQIIAKGVTRTQADKIKEKGYKGIGFQAVTRRVYPEKELAAQVLGFVNNDGVGNYGVEGYLNKQLQGVDGRLETVADVSKVPLTIGDRNIRIPAQNGKNVVLTIDRNIQSKTEQALADGLERTGATNASAVVMDPNTGRVLAMANLPTYHPGEYGKVTDAAVFNNATISSPYEPGSDVKTYTVAVAIDKGVAKASDTYNNTDSIRVGDRTISNSIKGHTGIISFQTALNWSLNTGFVTLAQRLGNGTEITREARDTMYEYFHNRFRLGQITGVELSNELAGILYSPDQVEGNAVRYSNMAFGQGMDVTMIQVSSGFCSIINGGNYYKPTVVDGYVSASGEYMKNATSKALEEGVISESTSKQVRQMTREARTSIFRPVDTPGYYVGGKTGTSQVIENGKYSDNETIGTYLGFGGSDADTPKYVIMVSISGDNQILEGAKHAMPIFTDISNWMLDYLKLQPKG